jgi:K+-sensing histidine kinase KdpD
MAFKSAGSHSVRNVEGRFEVPRPVNRRRERSQGTIGNARPADELLEVNRQMGEYLAELGHDFRTPLAAICNALQVLSLDGNDCATRSFVADFMERQTQCIGRLVDELVAVSGVEHGKLGLRIYEKDEDQVCEVSLEPHL